MHQAAYPDVSLLGAGPEFLRDRRAPCSVSAISLRRVTLHLMLGDVMEVLHANDVAGEIKDCIVICRSFSFVSGFAGLFLGWCHLLFSYGILEGLLPRFEWWPR